MPNERESENPDADALRLIKTAFAGRDALIERCFDRDESFRVLCVDYVACVAASECWKGRPEAYALTRWREYSDMLVALDRDLQDWIEALEDAGADQPFAENAKREIP